MNKQRLLELAGIAEDLNHYGSTTNVPSHILDQFEEHINELVAAIQLHVPDPTDRAIVVADITRVLKDELL